MIVRAKNQEVKHFKKIFIVDYLISQATHRDISFDTIRTGLGLSISQLSNKQLYDIAIEAGFIVDKEGEKFG